MEKKIVLLLVYIGVLLLIKNADLMKIQENRGFYIDNIDTTKDSVLESSYCLEKATRDQIEINF